MSRHRGLRILSVLVPALALVMPTAAHAERGVLGDSVGDVVKVEEPAVEDDATSDAPPEEVLTPQPDNESTDIKRVVIHHRTGLVKVTVHFRDVRSAFTDLLMLRVRTPRSGYAVYAERHGSKTLTLHLNGNEEGCGGLLTRVEKARDRVVVSMPTACIGDPRWVKVGALALSVTVAHDPLNGDLPTYTVDEAGRDAWTDSGRITMSDKVRRD